MSWINSDGLLVLFGKEEADKAKAGEYPNAGVNRTVEVKVDLTSLALTSGATDLYVDIPKGARIESIDIEVETAATSGGAAALNVGLVRLDRTTVFDEDGFVAALALASINAAGKKVTLINGSTSAGALIGTTLANAGRLVMDYDTAAYTAGRIAVRVNFYII